MKRLYVLAATALLLSIGCGGAGPMSKNAPRAMSDGDNREAMAMAGADQAKGEMAANVEAAKPRKIKYTAHAVLVVDDFDVAATQLRSIIDHQQGAYISKADVNVSPNSRRSGNWTIRVPVDHLESFMDAIAKIGELHQRTLDSEDITDKYYDMENRIKNRLVYQESLREMMKTTPGKLEDKLAVGRELEKVTEEIEVAKGQLQRWKSESDFSTVVLKMQDRRDYIPPPPTSPTFGTTISRNWTSSVDGLMSFLKGLVVLAVVLVPWLPVIALVLLPFYLLFRMVVRSLRRPEPAPLPVALPATPPPAPTA